jgi:cyclopropane-fatty-acyl-phospholipid synthase
MTETASRKFSALEPLTGVQTLSLRERLLCRWLTKLQAGRLTVAFPSGVRLSFGGAKPGPQATLIIRDLSMIWRLLTAGDLGLAEAYMAGEWETPDLTSLLVLGILNHSQLEGVAGGTWLSRLWNRMAHRQRANTRSGSRRNIAAHYDLGNRFYGCWLDETMSYSSALFDDMNEDHAAAQRRKYLRLAQALDLKPGDRVLEIGCGWGGFAEIAAREFGCKLVCLTLSREQAAFAEQRMARAGLADRVEVRIQDYRDVEGEFDKIVSIEMFEAVGEAYWPIYMETLKARLKPGGKAALQVITIDDGGFAAYRDNPDFIQRYIFPGGMLPSPSSFARAVADGGLILTDRFFFGASYAETIRRWDRAFTDRWAEIEKLGFDDRFHRMWRYYLAYCEAGFDTGRIDVCQAVIERP